MGSNEDGNGHLKVKCVISALVCFPDEESQTDATGQVKDDQYVSKLHILFILKF